jgi:hypothetical protein
MAGFCEHGDELSGSIKKAGYCLTSFAKYILHHGVSMYVSMEQPREEYELINFSWDHSRPVGLFLGTGYEDRMKVY